MPNRTISSFDDLLREARQQPELQRLLFVFAGAALPDDSTPEQRRRYAAGEGGALVPLMCVDKLPDELRSFSELVEESRGAGPEWVLVFVASLAGRDGHAPSSADAEGPLRSMVESIKSGAHGSFIPFDVEGRAVRLE